MATKLKNFSRHIIVKFFAIIIITVAIVFCGLQAAGFLKAKIDPGAIMTSDYIYGNRGVFDGDVSDFMYDLSSVEMNIRNEKDAMIDKTVEFDLPALIEESKYDYYIKLKDGRVFQTDSVSSRGSDDFKENIMIPIYGRNWYFDDVILRFGHNDVRDDDRRATRVYDEIFFDIKADVLESETAKWNSMHNQGLEYMKNVLIALAITLFMFIYLCIVAGRKPKDDEIHLNFIDKVYSDIQMLAVVIAVPLVFVCLDDFYYNFFRHYPESASYTAVAVLFTTLAVLLALLILTVLLSCVRKAKAKKFIKHSLIFTVISFVFKFLKKFIDLFKSLFDGRAYKNNSLTKRLFYSQLAFIVGSAILVLFTMLGVLLMPLFIVPIALEVVLVYWYIKGNQKTFLEINKGFNESVDEQMKAERMKINLVTNVSHDLKTPLTSIISYIDLLSKEEGLSDTAKDYVTILGDKSDRLKHIVADLFDVAKATSGNIPLEVEEIDVKKLVEQTIADMQDKIDSSGLTVKVNLTDEPTLSNTDGKKMYRVLQNVIDNALKYSFTGTRIFVSVENDFNNVVISVKNTAAYEIMFTADEVLQRFSRGDTSRSTEGNGLGLSIAQSFTDACGGKFEVIIDGDQFKVIIKLRKKENLSF